MRTALTTFLAFLLLLAFAAPGQESGQKTPALSLAAHIRLPGVKGRMDHSSVDLHGNRLFVAAVENHTLEIIDLKSARHVHTIRDLPEPQGVYYDPSTNHLFVACALDGAVRIFDGTSYQLIATVKFPDDADNVRYDARSKDVIVGYAGAKQLRNRETGTGGLGFINASGKKIADIVIDAHPESFQLEKAGSRIFVNVPEKKEIEVIDALKRSVLTRWPITAENNFPMALDEAHHRLFVGVWGPPQLLVFDTGNGKQVAAAEIAGSSDDIFYDSAKARIYVLTSKGALDVFQQKDPDHYERIARYATPPHSQTGLFVQDWGKLFVTVPAHADESAEIRVYETH